MRLVILYTVEYLGYEKSEFFYYRDHSLRVTAKYTFRRHVAKKKKVGS